MIDTDDRLVRALAPAARAAPCTQLLYDVKLTHPGRPVTIIVRTLPYYTCMCILYYVATTKLSI